MNGTKRKLNLFSYSVLTKDRHSNKDNKAYLESSYVKRKMVVSAAARLTSGEWSCAKWEHDRFSI